MTTPDESHTLELSPGQPSPVPPEGMGRLVLDCSHAGTAVLLEAGGPRIEINDREIRAHWGPWPVDLEPGVYQIRVNGHHVRRYGPAQLQATVLPGQVTTVYYRAPALLFLSGAIGFVPQPTRGLRTMIAVLVILLGVVVATGAYALALVAY